MIYFDVILKPIKELKIPVASSGQRKESISLLKHEYLDLDVSSGKFYVRSKFTGCKFIKCSSGELGVLDPRFLKKILTNEEENLIRVDGWNYTSI